MDIWLITVFSMYFYDMGKVNVSASNIICIAPIRIHKHDFISDRKEVDWLFNNALLYQCSKINKMKEN